MASLVLGCQEPHTLLFFNSEADENVLLDSRKDIVNSNQFL